MFVAKGWRNQFVQQAQTIDDTFNDSQRMEELKQGSKDLNKTKDLKGKLVHNHTKVVKISSHNISKVCLQWRVRIYKKSMILE